MNKIKGDFLLFCPLKRGRGGATIEALDIPEDHKVLIFTHITRHGGEQNDVIVNLQELEGLLTDFQKKTVYQGELIQADFTGCRSGEISAIRSGREYV